MYLLSGSFDTEVYIWVYIWKYLACNLEPRFTFCIYTCGVGLKWNSCAGTLTAKRVAQLVMLYMRERLYATVYVVRSLIFLSLWGHTKRTCIMINHSLHTCIVPPLISLLLGYVTLIHYDVVSWELHHVVGTDGSTSWKWEFPINVGTPALLWRVLHYAGYYEPPLYYWNEVYLEGQPWYEVLLTIQAHN